MNQWVVTNTHSIVSFSQKSITVVPTHYARNQSNPERVRSYVFLLFISLFLAAQFPPMKSRYFYTAKHRPIVHLAQAYKILLALALLVVLTHLSTAAMG